MNTVRRNIILNGIANIGQKGVNVANQLLLVPFFLDAWGAEYYGEWLTLTTIPSILMFSEMGFSTSACNAFVLAYSEGNHQKAANIFKTGFSLTTCCIILGIALSFGTMVFAKTTGLLDKSLISANDAIWALTFMMAGRLVGFYNQLFEGFFRSKHRAASAINYRTIEGFILIALGIAVLMSGYGIVAYALFTFIGSLLFNIGYAIIAIRVIGHLPAGRYDHSQAKMICGKGLGYMASPLWQAIYFQGTTLVVRTVLGAEAVAVFNTVRKVCRSVTQFFLVVHASVLPEMQIAIGKKNSALANRIFTKELKITILISVIGILFLSTAGLFVYNWWTKGMFDVPKSIWYIFVCGIFFSSVWKTSESVYVASNQPLRFGIAGIMSALITIAVSYILSLWFGFLGTAIGYVLFDVIMVITLFSQAKQLLKNIKE